MVANVVRTLFASTVLLLSSAAHSTAYQMQFIGGDTVAFVALNDAGTLVMEGFSDFICASRGRAAGMSALLRPPAYRWGPGGGFHFVAGLPAGPLEEEDICGVSVLRINSAGDMIGTSFRDGVRVPTFWREGLAYDLRDPANADLTFVPDPGVGRVEFDFEALDVINLSDFPFLSRPETREELIPNSAWTNAQGLYVFELNNWTHDVALLLPLAVPEPPAMHLLVLAGLSGWFAARYRRSSVGARSDKAGSRH